MKLTVVVTIAAALVFTFVPDDPAPAQGAAATCFEVIPARANIEPSAAMMIDKCSGRSWILQRSGRAYRWSLIATESEKTKTGDRVPIEGSPASPDGSPQKCFTFNNRKFCE